MWIVTAALLVAAASTLGDFLWAGLRLPHRVVYGLAHGTLLFLLIGWVLGIVIARVRYAALAGASIGLVAAGSFYLLAPVAGYAVMFLVWAFVWVALAVLALRRLPAEPASWRETLTRAGLAMAGAGAGFYAISGIWRPFNPEGWDYAVHFVSWTVAYLPPFAALLVNRPRRSLALGWGIERRR